MEPSTAAVDPKIDTYSGTITRLTLDPNTSTPDPNDYAVTAMQDLVVVRGVAVRTGARHESPATS